MAQTAVPARPLPAQIRIPRNNPEDVRELGGDGKNFSQFETTLGIEHSNVLQLCPGIHCKWEGQLVLAVLLCSGFLALSLP